MEFDQSTGLKRRAGKREAAQSLHIVGLCDCELLGGRKTPRYRGTNEERGGETPAKAYCHHYRAGIGPFPLVENADFKTPRELPNKRDLPSGGDAQLNLVMTKALTSEELEKILSGEYALYFMGASYYRDIFEIERTTQFSMYIGGDFAAYLNYPSKSYLLGPNSTGNIST